MPRFALLNADNRIVNVVALGRREDFTHVSEHLRDDAGEIILKEDGSAEMQQVETDDHLVAHGAVDLVKVNASVKVGMVRQGESFAWPAQPDPAQPALPASDSAQ